MALELIAWDGQLELEDDDWLEEEPEDDDDDDCCPFCYEHYVGCHCNEGA